MSKKAMLIIMDGWGKGLVPASDAIRAAHTPYTDNLYHQYPNSEIITCGEVVGLPNGQMGNSEVGHLNLGAGRIVYQELQRVNVAIKDGSLRQNPVLVAAFDLAKVKGTKVHFVGLVSNGGVHSHIDHLKALCSYAEDAGVPQYYVHAFTDGRDTDPKSGAGFIQELDNALTGTRGRIATVIGRYYAMDRDKRWERVSKAYDLLTKGAGTPTNDFVRSITSAYEEQVTDEFMMPLVQWDEQEQPIGMIQDEDIVICFNFRTDRCREIVDVLTQQAYQEYNMHPLNLHLVTATEYDATFRNVSVIFYKDDLKNTLGEVLQNAGKKQIRIAETEKYPHVTFFFSGGREVPFDGESRIMKASPKDVPTYDLKPEMSAYELKDAIIPEIEVQSADFICLNFANADMVGHTGVWEAAIKAAETVDQCVSEIVPKALENGYAVFLTADHGNSDYLVNEDGSPNTAHTLNPVPLFLISNDYKGSLQNGKLGDIAPTILQYMGISIPEEMTGHILIEA
ncbi:2,3-bisphosphoglycerate-independent phosphoglycerate mutase [Edaphocola aurantiacus]|uniref:2,3-bisphosphoglycerate-independent phosphoglycerate mutase n=1 Tax=Edaphocola aurantiacus TaxID=2601682 RepID=UPI001C981925|nr:2,3-bisphosphoglycerate-independent phosphoglycerate mutase [Edaphocola aurantiacus]